MRVATLLGTVTLLGAFFWACSDEEEPVADTVLVDVHDTADSDAEADVLPTGQSSIRIENVGAQRRYVSVLWGLEEQLGCTYAADGQKQPCRLFAPSCTSSCPDDPEEPWACIMCDAPPPTLVVIEAGAALELQWPWGFYELRPMPGCNCSQRVGVAPWPITLNLCSFGEAQCLNPEQPWDPTPVPCPEPDEQGRLIGSGLGEQSCASASFDGAQLPDEVLLELR